MSDYLGDFDTVTNKIVTIFFTTHAQTGASVAPLSAYEAGDIQLYKGNSATQRSSTTGWTITSPFDSITGLHCLQIDLSDNTDAGFYASANDFTAVLSADTETVDGLTVVRVIGVFSILNRTPLRPTTQGRTLVVDAAGLADANTVKVGPTGSGTAQTARDIGASVLLSTGTGTGQLDFTSGVVKANLAQILGTALTETAGLLAGGFKKFFNVATPTGTLNSIPDAVPDASGGLPVTGNRLTAIPVVAHVTLVDTLTTYTGNTPQTGDAYARIGANGVSLSAIPDLAGVTTLLSRLSATRAGYLDNLSAGAVALQSTLSSLVTTVGVAGAGLTAVALTSAYDFAKGTVAMTESYPSLHAAYTPAQAFFMLVQKLYERSVSSTTETIKGVDGSTTKMTETLNDASTPTAVTRAT